jgi:putative ATP-dependent endonuclease of OLD family
LDYAKDFQFNNISFFSEKDDNLKSLEPSLIEANAKNEKSLLALAKIALSTQAYKNLVKEPTLKDKKAYFVSVYVGVNGDKNYGSKKVDSAIKIFDSKCVIEYSDYLMEALNFD